MSTGFRAVLVATACVVAAGFAKNPVQSSDVTVHEWGTFTSVAGENGRAVPWVPLDGPADLPCFVARAQNVSLKARLVATVRMETPVLYFYAPRETTVDVRVGFKEGLITEYFPRAVVKRAAITPIGLIEPGSASSIAWRNVSIQPSAVPEFQYEESPNHYYAARATDAAPLEVGGDKERFLFYRGIGNFALPIDATVHAGDDVVVTRAGGEMPAMLLFENRGGRMGFRVVNKPGGEVTLLRPALDGNLDATRAALEQMLIAEGLYPREASAMVETWRDSWFTEGTRLLYVVPQSTVDAVLPLRIDPAPASIVRVFVGRLELATEATLSDIGAALRTNDQARLETYGRFLRPFAERLRTRTASAGERSRLDALVGNSSPASQADAYVCR